MALRKRIEREKANVSAESQEDDVPSDRNDVAPFVAARELRRRDREHKSKTKEMTEEEMMAMALQLSEHEANITAQRLQEEEEAMKKAIQDSIFADSHGLMDAAAPPGVSSRRKLVYSNGESTTDHEEGRGQRAAGYLNKARKHPRVEGSPLTEMPDLSQTQPSPSSSESAALGFQSSQSCDSTQIEDCDLLQSSVLTSPSAQVQVRVPRLNQDVLDSCATSGFVLCSQDSGARTQSSQCQQPSPTFPKSPASCPQIPASKVEAANSQMFDLDDDTQPELSQEPRTSPVFGRTDCTSALQTDTAEATALSFSSQESSSLDKEVSLIKSPVFSKTQVGGSDRGECQSPVFGTNGRTVMSQGDELEEQEDEKAEEEQSFSQTEPTIDMTLHWSEEDEDVTPVVSPSPVFPEERSLLQTVNDIEESTPSQTQHRSAAPQSVSAVSEAPCSSVDSAPQSTVHYYWGVPFCPRGLDPDQYTKVIVAQMEVYEKSLKQAQRGFLNKARWGEPILPQPENSPSSEPNSPPMILPTRRSWRLRGKQKGLESEEEAEEVTEDTQRSQRSLWEEEEACEEGDKELKQDAGQEEEEEQQKAVSEDQRENETQGESDCEVCPETQLSDDNTQELALPSQPLVKSPEIEMVQVDSPNVPEPQTPPTPEPEEPMVQGPESAEEPMESTKPGDMDLGGPHCEPQSRESPQQSQSPQPDPNPDSQELPGPDLVTGPDLSSSTESPVQCPLCQQTFPSDQIEMHAAFCDGAPATGDDASPKPRRKRMRRGESEKPNHTGHAPSVVMEKCYICQKLVPLRDYSLHTNTCLQRPPLRTANTGGLLSALDQSEPRDSEAGPSGSTARPHEVIDLVDDDDDDEEDSVSLIRISNSPIRSFTSISDAQDCLIDFSRQHQGKRPTRLGTKQRSKRR